MALDRSACSRSPRRFAGAKTRPKRSLLFVWHTGEELGLYGSEYFTDNPTVPRDSIVAQLNIDMIGRGEATDLPGGGPDYLQLLGSRRLSTEFGDLVEKVNKGRQASVSRSTTHSTPPAIRSSTTAAAITTSTRDTAFRSCS